jgi:hypothetical protein
MTLLDRTRELLARAGRELTDPDALAVVKSASARLEEPLRVAIAGMVKAGKSTLLNAMVGEELAPTDAGECTRVVTWYKDGPAYRVQLALADGGLEPRPFDRVAGALRVSLGRPLSEVDSLTVEVPSRRLRQHTLIDTPGLASLSADVSQRTYTFLAGSDEDDEPAQADAVIYLLRHMHGSDLNFLEAFHGDDLANGSPINAIGVLSRADEIGGCQLDSMESAARVASRYQADERMRRLCPVIVPVAGLLAAAGATLRESEFRALATLAAADLDTVVSLLLTASRFASAPTSVPVTPLQRRELLGRLGVFGVRLSISLIRSGVATNASALARELLSHSGLARLTDVLGVQFVSRAQVLKARSALATLHRVVGGHPGLVASVEEIRASAHEFVEVRLLHQLRSSRLPGRPEQLAEMERLLGGLGASASERLGLPPDSVPAQLLAAAQDALGRWLRVAEHPLSAREVRTAARATARSCEGIVASLSA